VADANGRRRERQRLKKHGDQQSTSGDLAYGCSSWGRWARQAFADSNGARLEIRQTQNAERARQEGRPEPCRAQRWATEPNVGRVAHGVPNRVDRLRCLGNAVVPQVAEVIGRAIMAMETEVRA
jgi:site-specific DNA-cytosine methylase